MQAGGSFGEGMPDLSWLGVGQSWLISYFDSCAKADPAEFCSHTVVTPFGLLVWGCVLARAMLSCGFRRFAERGKLLVFFPEETKLGTCRQYRFVP